jgi:hypothetical protein
MPSALFEDEQMLSREFPTDEDVWQHADDAGLVDVVDGKTVLEDGYTIRPCSTEEDTGKPIAVPPAATWKRLSQVLVGTPSVLSAGWTFRKPCHIF